MEFKFKYVNEEQLMKVIKKVQLERMCKQDYADLPLSSKERHANVYKEEEYPQSKEVEAYKDSQSVEENVNKKYFVCSPVKSRPRSVSLGYEAKEKYRDRANTLIMKLRNIRRNILTNLDELIVHKERIAQKDSYFKESNENLDEKVRDTKIKNCLCMIIRQEFPLVMNMRRLSLNAFRQDMISHLKVLLDCHNIALRILKIFIRGAPYVLKLDQSKEKLSGLLERMIALSSVCKLFSIEHNGILSSKDFLMDDVDRKCISLLASGKRRIKLFPKCEKTSEHLCTHCGVNTMTDDAQNDEITITKRKFKKLADRVFGCKEKSTEVMKRRKSHHKDHGPTSARYCKNKVNTLKEENKTTSNKGASDTLHELEHLVHDVNMPLSCGDTSLRDSLTGSESNYKVGKEETSNFIEEINEDDKPNAKETCEPFDGDHNHLPAATEQPLDKHQTKNAKLLQHSVYYDGAGTNKHLTSCSTTNDEQQEGTSSLKDDLKISDNIIKMSNTAGSISDRVIGECIRRVGCEVDNFVEDFVQKMFLLEFR